MGFFTNLLASTKDKQLAEVKFLIMMVGCDGEITKEEKEILDEILKIRNIPLSRVEEALQLNYASIPDVFPITIDGKSSIFSELLTLMCADGKCTREEIALLKYVSKKLGFSSNQVDDMFYRFVRSVDEFDYSTRQALISSYNNNK